MEPAYARPQDTARAGSLSRDQVEFYAREGYLVLPRLLDENDLEPIKRALSDKVDEIAAKMVKAGKLTETYAGEPFKTRLARMFEDKNDVEFLEFGRSWRDRHPGYFLFMSNPKILDAVESLIGSEIFANPVYNTRPKVPKVAAGAVPWHQDRSYWPGANANPVITVWIPLVDANEVNGCLKIWPRTHNTELVRHHHESHTGTAYTEVDIEDAELKQYKKISPVTLPIEAGGAILFNDRCIHMSTPNYSDHVRWSVDLRYQPTDQDPMREHGAGFLCRSTANPDRVADLEDWLAFRLEHETTSATSLGVSRNL
jgi:ectoine hydroxylase-related dioxygenase (phytanoyl-CoA dioxygenase family)